MIEEPKNIGLKTGSQNSCIAMRTPEGKIETRCVKTAVWYPKTLLQMQSEDPPIVGEEATRHAGAKYPLNLGLVETEEGVQQIKDILAVLDIPQSAEIVLASPAAEIKEGTRRLTRAIDEICNPMNILQFPEGVCSAVHILGDAEKLKDLTLLVANLGSSTFEFVCVNEANTILLTAHSEVSGKLVDEKILMRIKNSIGDALITLKQVMEIKESASLNEPKIFEVKGQTRDGIVQHQVSEEITVPLNEYVASVCEIIKQEIRTIKPEIRKAALEHPLIISGGMANIPGLPECIEEVLSKKLNYPIKILYSQNKDNHIAPAIGALMLAEALAKEGTA